MRILFISQYFYPENFRGNDIVFEFAKRHDVTVLTAIPNYPIGKFYNGYGLFSKRHETINGVNVYRVPVFPRRHGSISLSLNYISFLIFSVLYVLVFYIKRRYDLVFVQQLSPVTMSFCGVLYKKLVKVPLIVWVLDLWPESLIAAAGVNNKYVLNFFRYFALLQYKYADKIMISSKEFQSSIESLGNFHDKIMYLPQWAEDVFTGNNERNLETPTLHNGFRIGFAGSIGEAQGFEFLIKAIDLVPENFQVKWVIIGAGRKFLWLSNLVKDYNLEYKVQLLGHYPVSFMPFFFEKMNLLFVSLTDDLLFNITAPAKIQAYMASGKPILAMINGEGARLITDADCGWVVNAGDYTALAETVVMITKLPKEILDQKGLNGRRYYDKFFTKASGFAAIDKVIELLTKK
ncbi:MAG: glycosyltransferase family 4 protein [Sphingobacteriia bacterium]|nr:glycosyltransferase family 4 protein [Sphingobacteriia bacterium]